MAATSVRVGEDVKELLDRVQGTVQAETGERVSASELLRRLLEFARRHEMQFLAESGEEWKPPTKGELRKLFRGVRRWGVKTDVTKIDEVLYGGSPHE